MTKYLKVLAHASFPQPEMTGVALAVNPISAFIAIMQKKMVVISFAELGKKQSLPSD